MANIGIDLELVNSPSPNGIKVYIDNLLNNLLRIDKDNKYYFIHSGKNKLNYSGSFEEIIIPSLKPGIYSNLFQLPRCLSRYPLDIVHEPTHLGPFFTSVKYKKIITIYDLSPLILPWTRPMSLLTWARHKYGLPFLLNRVDVIIAISESTRRDLINYFNIPAKKIKVVYGGVDNIYKILDKNQVERFKKEKGLKGDFILSVGTLEPRKNYPFFLKAFYIMKKKYGINHKLIIIGKKGWKFSKVFKTIDKLGLWDDVVIMENVKNDELVSYYNACDVFVYPSLYEGFGLPVAEAMRCGCKVIALNTSSIPEITGDMGCLVPLSSTPDEFAKTTTDIINSENKRNYTKEAVSKTTEVFCWEKTAYDTKKIYEESLLSRC